jgi:hypothetical protein
MQEIKARKLSHKGARQKGKRLERDITKSLKGIGIDAQRVPLSGALSWLKGDVVEFNTVAPHLHECKSCERLELPDWWRQTIRQCLNAEAPVLHFTSNYQPTFTVLRTADFDDLVFGYERYRPELTLTLVSFPRRKDFFKFVGKSTKRDTVYTYEALIKDEAGLEITEELVIIPLEMYLRLRRYDLKRRADDVLTQPASAVAA